MRTAHIFLYSLIAITIILTGCTKEDEPVDNIPTKIIPERIVLDSINGYPRNFRILIEIFVQNTSIAHSDTSFMGPGTEEIKFTNQDFAYAFNEFEVRAYNVNFGAYELIGKWAMGLHEYSSDAIPLPTILPVNKNGFEGTLYIRYED